MKGRVEGGRVGGVAGGWGDKAIQKRQRKEAKLRKSFFKEWRAYRLSWGPPEEAGGGSDPEEERARGGGDDDDLLLVETQRQPDPPTGEQSATSGSQLTASSA